MIRLLMALLVMIIINGAYIVANGANYAIEANGPLLAQTDCHWR